jgi:hypothetical protein
MGNPNIIIMEGDTNTARLTCGVCFQSFRANIRRVTCADKQPVCRNCVEKYNPMRIERGLNPMPFDPSAYLTDYENVVE